MNVGQQLMRIRRRDFLFLLAALQTTHRASAQKAVPRLCFLTYDQGTAEAPTERFGAFFERLRQLGYVHPQSLHIDYIAAEGRTDQYLALAQECVALHPDIIAVTTTPGAHALKQTTQTIPIVMVALGDPVGAGLVPSLAASNSNLTGMSQMTPTLAAKRLELLKGAVPDVSRVLVLTYLVDPISPLQVAAIREVAPSLGITPLVHDIHSADDLSPAFASGMKEGAQALMTTAESIFRAERAEVTELAAHYKLPAIYPYAAFVLDSGGLMAYDSYDSDLHRSAADYVDKILKGANPASLPIQQPARLRLVVNLKTAKSLNLALPASVLAGADQLVE